MGSKKAQDLPLHWNSWRDDEVSVVSTKIKASLTILSEIHAHRATLRAIGYQVPNKSYGFPGDEIAQAEKASEQREAKRVVEDPRLSSATTAGR